VAGWGVNRAVNAPVFKLTFQISVLSWL
jgi:hypothetical protein